MSCHCNDRFVEQYRVIVALFLWKNVIPSPGWKRQQGLYRVYCLASSSIAHLSNIAKLLVNDLVLYSVPCFPNRKKKIWTLVYNLTTEI